MTSKTLKNLGNFTQKLIVLVFFGHFLGIFAHFKLATVPIIIITKNK